MTFTPHLWTALLLLASIPSWSASKSLLLRPFENRSTATETEVQQINEVFQNRVKTFPGWTLPDSTQLAASGVTTSCDLDCQVATAQKAGIAYILNGVIESVPNTSTIQITAHLIDPATRKTLQTEMVVVGPEMEKDFGKISGLAKLFDPASVSMESSLAPEETPNQTGTAAGWILGGAAIMVLVVVLYSLL